MSSAGEVQISLTPDEGKVIMRALAMRSSFYSMRGPEGYPTATKSLNLLEKLKEQGLFDVEIPIYPLKD